MRAWRSRWRGYRSWSNGLRKRKLNHSSWMYTTSVCSSKGRQVDIWLRSERPSDDSIGVLHLYKNSLRLTPEASGRVPNWSKLHKSFKRLSDTITISYRIDKLLNGLKWEIDWPMSSFLSLVRDTLKIKVRWLQQSNKCLTFEMEKMRKIATQFYRTLLSKEAPTVTRCEGRHLILRRVCKTVTEEMCAQLLPPFSCTLMHRTTWCVAYLVER